MRATADGHGARARKRAPAGKTYITRRRNCKPGLAVTAGARVPSWEERDRARRSLREASNALQLLPRRSRTSGTWAVSSRPGSCGRSARNRNIRASRPVLSKEGAGGSRHDVVAAHSFSAAQNTGTPRKNHVAVTLQPRVTVHENFKLRKAATRSLRCISAARRLSTPYLPRKACRSR